VHGWGKALLASWCTLSAVFKNKNCGSVSRGWNTVKLQVKSQTFICVTTNACKAGAVQGAARPQNQEGDMKEY